MNLLMFLEIVCYCILEMGIQILVHEAEEWNAWHVNTHGSKGIEFIKGGKYKVLSIDTENGWSIPPRWNLTAVFVSFLITLFLINQFKDQDT